MMEHHFVYVSQIAKSKFLIAEFQSDGGSFHKFAYSRNGISNDLIMVKFQSVWVCEHFDNVHELCICSITACKWRSEVGAKRYVRN